MMTYSVYFLLTDSSTSKFVHIGTNKLVLMTAGYAQFMGLSPKSKDTTESQNKTPKPNLVVDWTDIDTFKHNILFCMILLL